MGRRYFDERGREVAEERIAREWLGRNRERAMKLMGVRKAAEARPFEIEPEASVDTRGDIRGVRVFPARGFGP